MSYEPYDEYADIGLDGRQKPRRPKAERDAEKRLIAFHARCCNASRPNAWGSTDQLNCNEFGYYSPGIRGDCECWGCAHQNAIRNMDRPIQIAPIVLMAPTLSQPIPDFPLAIEVFADLDAAEDTRLKVEIMRECLVAGSGRGRPRKRKGPKRGVKPPPRIGRGPRQKTPQYGPGMVLDRGIGSRVKVWLTSVDPTNVRLTAAAATSANYEYHLNDATLPDPGNAAMVYAGVSAYSAFFSAYIIQSVRVSWTTVNIDAAVVKKLYLLPSPLTLGASLTTGQQFDRAASNLRCPSPKVAPAIGSPNRTTMSFRIPNMALFLGNPIEYRANFFGPTGGSPGTFIYMNIGAVSNANMTAGMFNDLKIQAKVEFYDRKMLLA